MDLDLISSVLIIIGIDIVLGGDNAIIIALACRNLPERNRNKAILLGTILAVTLRILLTIVAVYLLKIPFLQLVGGCFLLYIAYNLLLEHNGERTNVSGGVSLITAIRTIVIADIVMGFDNVIAIAGAAHGNISLVIFGLIVSVPIIIWGSKLVLFIMERFSPLVYVGAGILSYTAGKMMLNEKKLIGIYQQHSEIMDLLPLVAVGMVTVSGFIVNRMSVSNIK
ncbi:TerC family protein [Bacillus timonensis]|nr:TerC family protein [Bacillus timonensis]